MKRKWIRLVVATLVFAAIIGGVVFARREKPVEVLVFAVEHGRVDSTVSNTRVGSVKARRRAHLVPTASGQVAILRVDDGDRVSCGATLVELWNEDLRARLELAQSELKSADALAEEACVRARHAKSEAERQRKLHAEGLTQDRELEQLVSESESRAAACEAARSAVEVSEARVAVARADLDRTILKAPFDGVVAEVHAELGEFVSPAPTGFELSPVVDLIDDRSVYIVAPIDEVDASNVRVGMSVRVTLDAFPKRSLPGKVRRIAPYVLEREKHARTVDVEIDFDAPPMVGEERLLPGYSADVEIVLDTRDRVLRIPTESLLEGARVLVLADGQLVARSVRVGLSNWDFVEIVEGLEAGEQVVVSVGRDGVAEGAAATSEGVWRGEGDAR